MGDLIKLADKSDRGADWSVDDAIEHLKESLKDDPQYSKKGIFLLLDNEDPGDYNIRFISAGFDRTSDIIALLEIEISLLKREMGF